MGDCHPPLFIPRKDWAQKLDPEAGRDEKANYEAIERWSKNIAACSCSAIKVVKTNMPDIPTDTPTKVKFKEAEHQCGPISFDFETGILHFNQSGLFHITSRIMFPPNAGGMARSFNLYVNDFDIFTQDADIAEPSAAIPTSLHVSCDTWVAEGATMYVEATHDAGVDLGLLNDFYVFLAAHRVCKCKLIKRERVIEG